MLQILMNLKVITEEKSSNEERVNPKPQTKKMGRNEPCFCGSGKKFKHCHGAL
jgi:Predicted metal-binding protein related to the C-terminal domain of SecA